VCGLTCRQGCRCPAVCQCAIRVAAGTYTRSNGSYGGLRFCGTGKQHTVGCPRCRCVLWGVGREKPRQSCMAVTQADLSLAQADEKADLCVDTDAGAYLRGRQQSAGTGRQAEITSHVLRYACWAGLAVTPLHVCVSAGIQPLGGLAAMSTHMCVTALVFNPWVAMLANGWHRPCHLHNEHATDNGTRPTSAGDTGRRRYRTRTSVVCTCTCIFPVCLLEVWAQKSEARGSRTGHVNVTCPGAGRSITARVCWVLDSRSGQAAAACTATGATFVCVHVLALPHFVAGGGGR